jgi:hypothetical protein
MLANPGQQLNEVQLIEEIVLEPEKEFAVRFVACDRRAPMVEIVGGIERRVAATPRRNADVARPGEEPFAYVE